MKLSLTPKQIDLLLWALHSGLEQHQKFLRHDNWDWNMSSRERYESLWADRKFQRAIDLLEKKVKEKGKQK